VFNPALDEYVANAKVILLERKGEGSGSFLVPAASCKEIAEVTSDANGYCSFDKERLKINNNRTYFCSIKESWGQTQFYTCAGRTSGFIDVGKTQDIILSDEADAYVQVQYNNALNPSVSGDSLIVSISGIKYINPKDGKEIGGGINGGISTHDDPNYPFASILKSEIIKTIGQRLRRQIRKRKMGVVTDVVDTIKVYPNTLTTVMIDW
jgi:hypothetical protein